MGGKLGWTHPSHQNKFQMERRFKGKKKKKKKFKTFDSQTFSASDVRFCLNNIQDTGRLQIFHISRTLCVIKLPPSGHPTRGKCGPPPRPSAGISLYGSQRTELPQGFAKKNNPRCTSLHSRIYYDRCRKFYHSDMSDFISIQFLNCNS